MKKFIIITLLCIFVLLIAEFIAWLYPAIYYKNYYNLKHLPKIDYGFQSFYYSMKDWYSKDKEEENDDGAIVRNPCGLNFKKDPILLMGCSFTYGYALKHNQTFGHKLSQLSKRPVYNRATQGSGIAQMYWQTLQDDFYKAVPPPSDVIYVMIFDHYRRLLFFRFDIVANLFNPTYKFNKDKTDLVPEKINLYKRTFLYSNLYAKWIEYYIHENPKYKDELTDLTVLHFIKAREQLEKHYNKKINFTVLLYDVRDTSPIMYSDILTEKLKQNGFNVISTKDLTNEDLSNEKYFQLCHPSEAAWDLLTPKIIKKLNL